MEPKLGLTKSALKTVADDLQVYLATTYALYLKTQNFHWNLKAPEFYSLHLLFEKHYEELADMTDEIAERIASLGHYAGASFSAFEKHSKIKSSHKMTPYKQMIKELLEGRETLSALGRPLIHSFQELKDEASADLIIKLLGQHEKAAWMLRAHV